MCCSQVDFSSCSTDITRPSTTSSSGGYLSGTSIGLGHSTNSSSIVARSPLLDTLRQRSFDASGSSSKHSFSSPRRNKYSASPLLNPVPNPAVTLFLDTARSSRSSRPQRLSLCLISLGHERTLATVRGRGLNMEAFPQFKDGDVKIVVTGARQYQLHSSILRASSSTMRRLLDEQYTAKLTSKAVKKGVVVRNRLVAIENPEPLDDEPKASRILEPVNLDSDGKRIDGKQPRLDLENGMAVPYIVTAYHAVLGAFYHVPIDFGEFGEIGLTGILEVALTVVEVAEYLDVVDMITKPIESTLLSTGQTVHNSICLDPAAWLDFACRIKSKVIFREAVIHSVGQYNTPAMQTAMQSTLEKPVVEVIKRKAAVLMKAVKKSFMKVLSYYPSQLQRGRRIGLADVDNFGRNSYANDIYSWMALTVFRHYIMQHVADDQTHRADNMGHALVRAIGEGGDAYLDKQAVLQFHHLFPMSARGSAVVENKLNDIKEEVKRFVVTILQNNSQLYDVQKLKFFTCANVEARDYPWSETAKTPEEDEMEVESSQSSNGRGHGETETAFV